MIINLTYSIADERLTGSIGAARIDCPAGSGGLSEAGVPDANGWAKDSAIAGGILEGMNPSGPLPQGKYYLQALDQKLTTIRLDPFPSNVMFGRKGFLIHGRSFVGVRGSIVPYNYNDVVRVFEAVKFFVKAYNRPPVLQVVAESVGNSELLSAG